VRICTESMVADHPSAKAILVLVLVHYYFFTTIIFSQVKFLVIQTLFKKKLMVKHIRKISAHSLGCTTSMVHQYPPHHSSHTYGGPMIIPMIPHTYHIIAFSEQKHWISLHFIFPCSKVALRNRHPQHQK
jgi:hypothetical protein